MASTDTGTADTAAARRPGEIQAVPVRHPGRWVAAAIIVILAATISSGICL